MMDVDELSDLKREIEATLEKGKDYRDLYAVVGFGTVRNQIVRIMTDDTERKYLSREDWLREREGE